MLSIDTKKKELIGNFASEGPTYTQAQVQTLDHDFPSAGQGKASLFRTACTTWRATKGMCT